MLIIRKFEQIPPSAKQYLFNISISLLLVMLFINIVWAFRNSNPKDFGSFYAAGKAYIANQEPYSYNNELVFNVEFDDNLIPSPNLNPPISLLLTSIFTILPIGIAYPIWQVTSIILYWVSLLFSQKQYRFLKSRFFWGLCLAGFWHTIETGQIYTLLLLFLVLALFFIEKKKILIAAIFIGLFISIKPNFVLWIIILFFAGYRKISIYSLIATILFSILPFIIEGFSIYSQWITASKLYDGYILTCNGSIFGLATRLGNFNNGYIPAFVIFVLGLIVVIQNKPEIDNVNLIGLCLSLLCSPIAWPGYTIFLLPILLKIRWNIIYTIIAIYLSIPVPLMYIAVNYSEIAWVVYNWIYGFAIFLLFVFAIYNSIKAKSLQTNT